MVKVCMITTGHNPLDDRIFYKEAKSLKNVGYDITVIGQTDSRMDDEIDGISIIGLKIGKGIKSHPILWWNLLQEALRTNAVIYHCHEPESLLVALYLKIFKHKNIVYDVHEYYPDMIESARFQMKIFLIFMLYFIEPFFCRYIDLVITADESIAKKYKMFNNNVYSIPNFPLFEMFDCSNGPERIPKYKDCHVVIYVGGINEERGIFELICAIRRVSTTIPSIKLILVGTFGNEYFKKICKEYVELNNLGDNVEFIGFVPHNEIAKYINSSDIGSILLYPTKRFVKTAYPIKLFEYMICGKPIIASDLPAMGKIIKDSHCGVLVNPMNIDDISRKIIYLLEHPDEAKKMGECGRRAVERKYNWNEVGEKLTNIYGDII